MPEDPDVQSRVVDPSYLTDFDGLLLLRIPSLSVSGGELNKALFLYFISSIVIFKEPGTLRASTPLSIFPRITSPLENPKSL